MLWSFVRSSTIVQANETRASWSKRVEGFESVSWDDEFGPHTTEAESFAIMDRALELGINFFDTADVYGWKAGEGVTEQIVGRWFAQGGGRREKVVLATKVYGEMNLEGMKDPNLAARAFGAEDHRRLRGEPAKAPDRPNRSLPDASHRPDMPIR